LRASYLETNIDGDKTVSESKRLIVLDTVNLSLTLYGATTEKFDLYEDFDIGEGVHMYPGLDKEGKEWAIEYYPSEEWIYITIQDPIENEDGSFDSVMYVCKKL
jgi:hypothetical protein